MITGLALNVRADFVHIMLQDSAQALEARFRQRRAELNATNTAHPAAEIDEEALERNLAGWLDLLDDISSKSVMTIDASQGVEQTYAALTLALGVR